jgi:gelsolin
MLKQKEYNISDSNIALLGSDLDKKVKLAAAKTEKAWNNAGKKEGLEIWRIEKFNVVPIPTDTYGTFYSGDSYIVLHTYKKKPDAPALSWDVHFWLGKFTTQDEAGTAAYKTVELDDLLGGIPTQYREVQGHETDRFMGYFKDHIHLLDGGVESGFKHVEPEKYQTRLLQLKGRKKVRVSQVELSYKSLNSGDVFIMDAGLKIYQWNGSKSGPQEKMKGAQVSRALVDGREGLPQLFVMEEYDKVDANDPFWKTLGTGPIQSSEAAGSDEEAEKKTERVLLRLNIDNKGALTYVEVAKDFNIKRSSLVEEHVFIFDTGSEVYAWIGKKAVVEERKKALSFAQDYLTKHNKPVWTPISRVLSGSENQPFEASFN